ncbi:hypothetical protein ABZ467_32320 [Streptomyces sp. NPDC005727]|uniref:hypothetical protein n=1 Tax=Streptomyces sp. NPDC005727 TaxID=3157053 RepID=UPI0033E45B00
MKIRIGTPQATNTVPGTISRPQRLATDRDSQRLMLAEKFETEMAPRRVEGSDTACWEVHTLTIRARKIIGRRTRDAWTHRRFYYPAEFHDGVPDWVRTLAEQVLRAQLPPVVARRTFSIPDQPQQRP